MKEHDKFKVTCPYDYVKIDSGPGQQAEKYCGHTVPQSVLSVDNVMHILFVSNKSVGHRGFKATYRAKTPKLDCGNPGTPSNGTKTGSNYFFPNLVSYSCKAGFRLVGSVVRKCQNNSLWSGSPVTCQRVWRGDPGYTSPISGVERNYVFEDEVVLKCQSFYARASGSHYRKCQQNGTWSGSQLICSPICGMRTYYNRGKIVGGSATIRGSYSWMTMLYQKPCSHMATSCAFCGGAILNSNYI